MLICVDRRAPLVPIGSLTTCTSRFCPSAAASRSAWRLLAVLALAPDVGDVQERRARAADVDERRLHAGQHAHDTPHADVADQPARGRAFDVHLLHDALLDHRNARFLRRDVDQDFFGQRPWARMLSPNGNIELPQQFRGLAQRQAHDAGIAAAIARHEHRRASLDSRRRRPCPAARRSHSNGGFRVSDNSRNSHVRDRDAASRPAPSCAIATAVSTWCVAPGERAQDARRVLGVLRLADDLAVEYDGGIGGEHRYLRAAPDRRSGARPSPPWHSPSAARTRLATPPAAASRRHRRPAASPRAAAAARTARRSASAARVGAGCGRQGRCGCR